MKILLLTTFDTNNVLCLTNCKNQYQMFTYFIYNKLKESGHNIILMNYRVLEYENADHCLVIINRGIQYESFIKKIKSKVSGCISTMSASHSIVGFEDVLFYLIPSGKRRKFKCRYIGWACDSELCYSNQNKNNIRILIDHPYYGSGRIKDTDKTLEISKQAVDYFKNKNDVIIRRLCVGGAETVTEDNYNVINKYVQNKGMSYEEACNEYSLTDVYFVTHYECMGLVVLECAMSGALIVSPKGYIKDELLKSLNHITYTDNNIPWDEIIRRIDHNKSRDKALKFNWTNSCNKILDTFINWDKYKDTLVFNNYH